MACRNRRTMLSLRQEAGSKVCYLAPLAGDALKSLDEQRHEIIKSARWGSRTSARWPEPLSTQGVVT